MKKRILSVILTLAVIFSLTLSVYPAASAASGHAVSCANSLYKLGLFIGSGTNPDKTPDFALDRAPTRAEAVVMLIRLLGKEYEARTGGFKHPFQDVEDWATPYVGYAYAKGLSNGTSETTYGGNETITAPQFITLVLRALGYKSGFDFQWYSSYKFSDSIGLTDGSYNESSDFLRGDAAILSYCALFMKLKGSSQNLLSYLYTNGTVTAENVEAVGLSNLIKDAPRKASYTQ